MTAESQITDGMSEVNVLGEEYGKHLQRLAWNVDVVILPLHDNWVCRPSLVGIFIPWVFVGPRWARKRVNDVAEEISLGETPPLTTYSSELREILPPRRAV